MSNKRGAIVTRKTNETDISVNLNIDGEGKVAFSYPVGFFCHLLHSFARHGLFDLEISAKGDLEVDQHHLIEDTGIVLGTAFSKALAGKKGIKRVGSCLYPMDETLARAACDFSGRGFLVYEAALETGFAGEFQADTACDFWHGFVQAAGCALHLEIIRGRSAHHKLEALFKASGRAIREACEIDNRAQDIIPSTKGVLDNTGIFLC